MCAGTYGPSCFGNAAARPGPGNVLPQISHIYFDHGHSLSPCPNLTPKLANGDENRKQRGNEFLPGSRGPRNVRVADGSALSGSPAGVVLGGLGNPGGLVARDPGQVDVVEGPGQSTAQGKSDARRHEASQQRQGWGWQCENAGFVHHTSAFISRPLRLASLRGIVHPIAGGLVQPSARDWALSGTTGKYRANYRLAAGAGSGAGVPHHG
jgi:hypothetical protein